MSKRFTATEKWDKAWFRLLTPKHKCLWNYICERCDQAGVWEPDFDLASFQIGERVSDRDIEIFGDRVLLLETGKYWIVDFVDFQFGKLSKDCPAHKPIYKAISKNGLDDRVCHRVPHTLPNRVPNTLQEKEKEEEKEKEGESEGESKPEGYHVHARVCLHFLNEKAGKHFRETDSNLKFISARLSEDGVDVDGVKKMISRQCSKWRGDPKMQDYLRPETLFNATKFDSYYATRDQPLTAQGIAATKQPSVIDCLQ